MYNMYIVQLQRRQGIWGMKKEKCKAFAPPLSIIFVFSFSSSVDGSKPKTLHGIQHMFLACFVTETW